ncbi:hypothetical protein LguiA_035434 [Lonicera macranthoides]
MNTYRVIDKLKEAYKVPFLSFFLSFFLFLFSKKIHEIIGKKESNTQKNTVEKLTIFQAHPVKDSPL